MHLLTKVPMSAPKVTFSQTLGIVLAQKFETSIMSSMFASYRDLDTRVFKMSAQQKMDAKQLVDDRLPDNPNLCLRGSIGLEEAKNAAKSQRFGRTCAKSRRPFSLDVPEYVIDHNSSGNFFSLSQCKYTVKPYSSGLAILPSLGVIFVSALPKVVVRPQVNHFLNPEMTNRAFERIMKSRELQGIEGRPPSLSETIEGNNEVTQVIGFAPGEDLRLDVNQHMHSVVVVSGPGRVAGKFQACSNPVFVTSIENPDFQYTPFSLEIQFGYEDETELMTKRAVEMGLIEKGQRIVVEKDARALLENGVLDQANPDGVETLKIMSVPASIAIGDGLELASFLMQKKDMQLSATESAKQLMQEELGKDSEGPRFE